MPKKICKFYARGWCRYGESCRFYHPPEVQMMNNEINEGSGKLKFVKKLDPKSEKSTTNTQESVQMPHQDGEKTDPIEAQNEQKASAADNSDVPAVEQKQNNGTAALQMFGLKDRHISRSFRVYEKNGGRHENREKKQLSDNLKAFGFEDKHISRAFRVYEKNYGLMYDMNVITEIIVRLQTKDSEKGQTKVCISQNGAEEKVNISYGGSSQMNLQVGGIAMWQHANFGMIAVQVEKVGKGVTISFPLEQPPQMRQRETVPAHLLQPMSGATDESDQKESPKKSPPSGVAEFVPHMSLKECNNLRTHDKIDHRDSVGRFIYATVSEKHGSNLKIHYERWSQKWDCYSDYRKELHRFAKADSICKRVAHRFKHLKKGDFVDLNPIMRHPGWRPGEIRRKDDESGQVQVVYEYQDKHFLYWTHLDNKEEIAEFTSKTGTDQDYQNQIAKEIATQNNQASLKSNRPNKQNGRFNSQQINVNKKQDEMDTVNYNRMKRFPKLANEIIENMYNIGDELQVFDLSTQQWITTTVTDKENNWIVVHCVETIHVVKDKKRLRSLDAFVCERESIGTQVENLGWKLMHTDSDASDANSLHKSFAIEIYGNEAEYTKVRNEEATYRVLNGQYFESIAREESEIEIEIKALSQLYNVRVIVFELNQNTQELSVWLDLSGSEQNVDLPLIMLAKHGLKLFYVIQDPAALHARPLGNGENRIVAVVEEQEDEKNNAHVAYVAEEREKSLNPGKEEMDEMEEIEKDVTEAKKEEKEKKVEKKALSGECCVCLSNGANMVAIPCGHIAMCKQCSDGYEKGNGCPVCRQDIQNLYQVYVSGA